MNNVMRNKVKVFCALQSIKYKEIAEYLEIKPNSFYCWLKGYYDFSCRRLERLQEILDTLKE